MERNEYIPLEVFCSQCNVTSSFVEIMAEAGWIEITRFEEKYFIPQHQLADAERLARLNTDLEINPEGIDVVMTLLQRMQKMQQEITVLKDELRLYRDR
jgi:hypothetical protein